MKTIRRIVRFGILSICCNVQQLRAAREAQEAPAEKTLRLIHAKGPLVMVADSIRVMTAFISAHRFFSASLPWSLPEESGREN